MSKSGRKALKYIKNSFIYVSARGLFWLAGAIPLRIGLRLGPAVGSLAWHLLRYERECSRNHLRVAFPDLTDHERDAIGKETYGNLGRSFFELFHFDELLATVHTDRPYVEWIGHEHTERILAEGRGGIQITGHIGNWELMAAWTAALEGKVYEIVRSLYDPRLDKALNDHRRHYNYIPLTRGGADLIADIAKVFQENHWLGILIDQDTKVRGVFADWFGYPAWTPSGPAYLCYQAGLDAVVTTIHRNEKGGHTIVTCPPIPRPQTGDLKADIQAYTELLNRELCNRIRQYPTEWVWMHRRWKTRPPGEPSHLHPAPRPPKPQRMLRAAERLIMPIARRLSWKSADRLGAGVGRLLRLVLPGRRKIARQNIERAFPGNDRTWHRRVERETFANFGRVLVEYLRHDLMDSRFFAERVEVEGAEYLKQALEKGKGAIVIGAHFGGWEPAMWKLATEGFPVHMAAKRLKNSFLNSRLVWLRRSHGVESYPEKKAAFPLVRALKRNEVVVAVMDQHATGAESVPAEFLGLPVKALNSTARLAARYGCPVLPGWSLRTGPGRFRVVIGEPLDLDEDIAVSTQCMLTALEEIIRTDPAQWFWLHNRWK